MIILRQRLFARRDYAGLTEENAVQLRAERSRMAQLLRKYRNESAGNIDYNRAMISRENHREVPVPSHFNREQTERWNNSVSKEKAETISKYNNRISDIENTRDRLLKKAKNKSEGLRTELLNNQLDHYKDRDILANELEKQKGIQQNMIDHQNKLGEVNQRVNNRLLEEQTAHNATRNTLNETQQALNTANDTLKKTQESLTTSNTAREAAEKNAAKLGKSLRKWKVGAGIAAGTGLAAGGYALYKHNKK